MRREKLNKASSEDFKVRDYVKVTRSNGKEIEGTITEMTDSFVSLKETGKRYRLANVTVEKAERPRGRRAAATAEGGKVERRPRRSAAKGNGAAAPRRGRGRGRKPAASNGTGSVLKERIAELQAMADTEDALLQARDLLVAEDKAGALKVLKGVVNSLSS